MRRFRFAYLISAIALFGSTPALAGGDDGPMAMASSNQRSVKLEGRAEVESTGINPNQNYEAWRASQAYRYAAAALQANQFKIASQWFKVAGDGFEASLGESKFLAEARYAEAQSALLAREPEEANHCFRIAVKLFRKYDPQNPYLKAGQAYLDKIDGKGKSSKPLEAKISTTAIQASITQSAAKFQSMEGKIDNVGNVVLKGKANDGAFKLAALKDGDAFSAKLQEEAAAVDVSDKYVKDTIYKGFIKMTCLEFAALGGNYYTAPDLYHSFKSPDGKTIMIGATDDAAGEANPVLRLNLNDTTYNVPMFLPGIAKSSRNVLVINDGKHVLAIDPHKQDVWKLVPVWKKKGAADFSWWKLTHVKKGNINFCPKPELSGAARAKMFGR